MFIIELTYKGDERSREISRSSSLLFVSRDPFGIEQIADFKITEFAVTKRSAKFNY